MSRHHAWAGGILLSVLLAIRILIFDNDTIIIPIGVALIVYILVALFFTYKYSSGLATEQKTVQEVHIHSDEGEIEKQRLKIEKKKAKAEAKKAKKSKKD
jgi:hypothetical protein